MKTESVDGVKLAYEEYGSGPPIVFVHGFGASSYSWRQIAASLSGYRSISINLMGFGHSEKPKDESYTIDRQAALLRQFILQKGLESPVLVGHSYGGGVCLAMMRQLHDVSRLILVDSMCYPQRFPFFITALRSPVLRRVAFELVPPRISVTSLLKQVYYRADRIKPETVDEYVGCVESEGARNALIRTAESIIPPDVDQLIGSYRQISVPTLIIWGEHDRIVPISLGERLSKDIPSAEFKVIPDCGHAPQEELPEETLAVVSRFLTNHG